MVDKSCDILRNVSIDHAHLTRPERYFQQFILICLAVAGRPRYSMTSEPLGMRSWVKVPCHCVTVGPSIGRVQALEIAHRGGCLTGIPDTRLSIDVSVWDTQTSS